MQQAQECSENLKEIHRLRCKDNIELNLRVLRVEGADCNDLSQDSFPNDGLL
jgi:hypothetical protein